MPFTALTNVSCTLTVKGYRAFKFSSIQIKSGILGFSFLSTPASHESSYVQQTKLENTQKAQTSGLL